MRSEPVKVYEGANIRNVVMMGHGHAGKTSLVSAMLYTAGATQRLGRVDDGTAPTDYDDEEIARKMSIGSSLAYVEWGKSKINVVDTPGFSMFVHEAKMVLPVVEAAIVVVDGVAGVEVVTQRIWSFCEEFQTPRLIVASRMDRERADAERVMDFVVDYTPAPTERGAVEGEVTSGNGEPPRRKVADSEPTSLYVFKTVSDPFAGRISYFKVFSGVLKNDAVVQNFTRGSQEKLAHISIMQGKTAVPVPELHAGDIGAVAKLRETLTGDTLGDKAAAIRYPKVSLPEPAITFAIEPKSRADEDKLGVGIHKLMEEDAMQRFFRDAQTKEFLIAGTGQQHIEVAVAKMKKRYHTEVNLKAPKVPYRETIRGRADVQGRHKKQTGGHGQYGDCKIKMEPLPRGSEFEFVNDIFGGAIPRNFIPAVEKGIKDAAARGYLAGFPVVDFRVVLYDGSYHDVDSND